MAQFPGYQPGAGNPASRPAVNPIINMANPNTNPVINYYGIYQPGQQLGTSIQQLQQQQVAAAAAQSQGYAASNVLPPTGHGANFQTQGRYFFTRGGGGAIGR